MLSPESSAEPGRWRTHPYQRAILDAFTAAEIERITVMKSARVGYTKCLNWAIAYGIHHDPAPILVVQPTVDDAKGYSKDEIAPMLRDVPVLAGVVAEAKSRDSNNTIEKKHFPGGHLTLIGANSARGFRRLTVKRVFFDETDGYPPTAGQEGDQIELGIKRTATFWDRKIALGSTPTLKGESRIESSFESSDKGYPYLPCPHCDQLQRLEWDRFDIDASQFACPHCGALFGHEHLHPISQKVEWIGENWWYRDRAFTFSPEFSGHIGFHIWSAYSFSPDAEWPKLAKRYKESKDDPQKLRTFHNLELGLPYELRGDAPDADTVEEHRGEYMRKEMPDDVVVLTSGVDVQKNRLFWVIRGWDSLGGSWLYDYGELIGDTDKPAVWNALYAMLKADFGGRRIRRMAIDSGYRSPEVYAFCRRIPQIAIPTKGKDTLPGKSYSVTAVDVTIAGKIIRGGVKLWTFDADEHKRWLHERINWPADVPGGWRIPNDASDDYCNQLMSEERTVDNRNKPVWLVRGPNHFFDAEVLAYLAWNSMQRNKGALPAAVKSQSEAQRKHRQRPRQGLFR